MGAPSVPQPGSSLIAPPTSVTRTTKVMQIRMNGTTIGSSITPAQYLELVAPDGSFMEVLAIFDGGSDNTHIDVSMAPAAWNIRTETYKLATLNHVSEVTGRLGQFCIRSRHDKTRHLSIDCLLQDMAGSQLVAQDFPIPKSWGQEFGLGQRCKSASGLVLLVIGLDCHEYFPMELRRHGKLRLNKSVLDGEYIISGCIQNENSEVYNYTNTPISAMRRTRCIEPNTINEIMKEVEGNHIFNISYPEPNEISTKYLKTNVSSAREEENRLIKTLEIQNFGFQQICKKCITLTKDCSSCHDEYEKSPKIRFEEEILESGLSFNEETGWTVEGRHNEHFKDVEDSRTAVVNFQKRLERKIQNNPELVDGLNKAIQRRIDSGVFIYLSDLKMFIM